MHVFLQDSRAKTPLDNCTTKRSERDENSSVLSLYSNARGKAVEMATIELPFPNTSQPGKILKWRVSKGTMVSVGRILLLYQNIGSENTDVTEKKLRATQFGRVTKLHVKEGDIIQPG